MVCRLRKKLAVAGLPNLITTVCGRGYVLREPPASAEAANENAEAHGMPLFA